MTAARANALLATQRAGLGASVAYWSQEEDAYSRQKVGEAQTQLARVTYWEGEIARCPELADLALEEIGQNGHGPAIDLLVRETPSAKPQRIRRAA